MTDIAGKTRILICRTCPRYEPNPRGEITAGTRLGVAVKQALAVIDGDELEARAVNCLAGCKNPCNVALDADDKTRLRFSRLDNRHIEPLITAALAHFHSPTGDIAEEDMPEDLRQRLSARSPPRIGG